MLSPRAHLMHRAGQAAATHSDQYEPPKVAVSRFGRANAAAAGGPEARKSSHAAAPPVDEMSTMAACTYGSSLNVRCSATQGAGARPR